MKNEEIQVYKATYERGGQFVVGHVFAMNKHEAMRKARANGIIKDGAKIVDYWQVVSLVEVSPDV